MLHQVGRTTLLYEKLPKTQQMHLLTKWFKPLHKTLFQMNETIAKPKDFTKLSADQPYRVSKKSVME
jgi:hypothetical protein